MLLLVPDSFKECLSAARVTEIMQQAILETKPGTQVLSLPFSDGGEGFTDAVYRALGGVLHVVETVNAVGEPIQASCLVLPNGIGVLEVAEASGLAIVPPERRNPMVASSFGTGMLFKHLVDRGCKEVWLGLGGSAVNDGGAGFLQALGMKFNGLGFEGILFPEQLDQIYSIEPSDWIRNYSSINVLLAADVENPLLGPNGATYTFARQKGASDELLPLLESRMNHWSRLLINSSGRDCTNIPGSGAAGGIGFALMNFFKTRHISGFELLAKYYELDQKISESDLVITGEGCFDETSVNGKLIGRLINRCRSKDKKLLVFCGVNKIQKAIPNVEVIEISQSLSWPEAREGTEERLRKKMATVLKKLKSD